MSVPTHLRYVVRGHFSGTPEFWSTSAHFTRANQGEPDAGFDDIDEAGISDAVSDYFSTSLYPSSVVVDDWRIYVIGTDGKMEGNGPLMGVMDPGTVHGAAGPHQLPPQISLCCTLVADNRGPGKFGRMFLPTPNVSLESDGRVGLTQVTAQAEGLTEHLKRVSDAIDLEVLTQSAACNVSPGPIGSTTGTLQEVDHIEVGRVLDTIRNRRKSMDEERYVHGQIDW